MGKKLGYAKWCARMGATDLVLEVANEWAEMECEEESDEEWEEEV